MRVPAGGVGGVVPELVRELLREERTVLGRLRERLVGDGGTAEDVEQLRQAELDLDELFLLVVVGEFNSGKSAFINALLGARVLREGVTPTTAVITRLSTRRRRRSGGRGRCWRLATHSICSGTSRWWIHRAPTRSCANMRRSRATSSRGPTW